MAETPTIERAVPIERQFKMLSSGTRSRKDTKHADWVYPTEAANLKRSFSYSY